MVNGLNVVNSKNEKCAWGIKIDDLNRLRSRHIDLIIHIDHISTIDHILLNDYFPGGYQLAVSGKLVDKGSRRKLSPEQSEFGMVKKLIKH